jgi:hypothetical protein
VARIAAALGYDVCASWVHGHRDLYARGIFRGFEPDGGRKSRRQRPGAGARRAPARIGRRLPEGGGVRVTLHDRDGRVLFEGDVR